MYEEELAKIRKARNSAYMPDFKMAVAFILFVVSSAVFPPLAVIFLIVFAFIAHSKIVRVARMPCPQCKLPFGTNAKIVLGLGTDKCESCGLSLF